jgi:hypothetical protein
VAYYIGGYVAGRMSRFDGGQQGVGVWIVGLIMTLLLAAVAAVLGASYNLLQQMNLPTLPVDSGSLTGAGLITLILVAGVSLLAAIVGGTAGTRYHRVVDRAGRVAAQREVMTDGVMDGDEAPTRSYTRTGRPMPTFGERIEPSANQDGGQYDSQIHEDNMTDLRRR